MNAFKLHVKYLSKSGVREGKCLGQSYLGKKKKKRGEKKTHKKINKKETPQSNGSEFLWLCRAP